MTCIHRQIFHVWYIYSTVNFRITISSVFYLLTQFGVQIFIVLLAYVKIVSFKIFVSILTIAYIVLVLSQTPSKGAVECIDLVRHQAFYWNSTKQHQQNILVGALSETITAVFNASGSFTEDFRSLAVVAP